MLIVSYDSGKNDKNTKIRPYYYLEYLVFLPNISSAVE